MTNEEIKEKYGIEPIMKEGWCWDDDNDKETLKRWYCVYKDSDDEFSYNCILELNNANASYTNFSDTDPNIIEPKVGDWGWFWNDEKHGAYYGKLVNMYDNRLCAEGLFCYTNFSHEKPDFFEITD